MHRGLEWKMFVVRKRFIQLINACYPWRMFRKKKNDRPICIPRKNKVKKNSERNACFHPVPIPLISYPFPSRSQNLSPKVHHSETPEKAENPETIAKTPNRKYKKTQNSHLRNTFCIVSSGMSLSPPFVHSYAGLSTFCAANTAS